MRRALAAAAILSLSGAVLLAAGAYYFRARTPATNSEPEIDDPVGDFSLTERSGKVVNKDDLLGKVWVASFVFTRCTGPCPQVTATMTRLQAQLASHGDDVRLVTFTVDPEHDDPGELRTYADHFGADPQRWLFLTGTETDVYRLVREGFHLTAQKDAEAGADAGSAVLHDTRLAVVDRKGRIRGYYQGVVDPREDDPVKGFEDNLERLKRKVEDLVREAP
jgi:cytochrome oxidase Cu insertion factor (SCO1/SenC/PrrC family)